jgi:hypothetical protein
MKSYASRAGIFSKVAAGLFAAGVTVAASEAKAAFNFDTGNAPIEIVIPTVIPTIFASVAPSDATLVLRYTTLLTNGWFDAIAPYHPTAIGVYSQLPRRPAAEGATNANKNVAILYASYHICNSLWPASTDMCASILTQAGLDPNDTSTNVATPVGIGNVAGKAVVAYREHDGMNQLGDEGGRLYNRVPYSDYTGFVPANTAYDLDEPSKWQPSVTTLGFGIFKVQQFVTPQFQFTEPYSIDPDEVDDYSVPAPKDSNPKRKAAYKAQVDQVLAVSANLTDQQKMTAELFNNKIRSLGFAALFVAISRGFTLDEFVQYDFMTNLAAFDGGIVTWRQKLKWNAVRPFSAIRYVYGDKKITAWGGPGKGTVTDLPASQWESYLKVPDHGEYPSGSTCFCAAHAQSSRRFLGSDAFGWSVPAPKGSSVIEPGVTPANDITLGPWNTFTEFENTCGLSRNYGGVHFLPAITNTYQMCRPIGDRAYEFVMAHINGTGN